MRAGLAGGLMIVAACGPGAVELGDKPDIEDEAGDTSLEDTDSGSRDTGSEDSSEPIDTSVNTDTVDTSDTSADVSLLAIDPASGSTSGGAQVTLTGEGFDESASVFFGSGQAGVVLVEPDRLVVLTPASAVDGPVDVRVSGAGGEAALAGGFTYVEPCTGVTPTPASVSFTCRTDATATVTLTGCATGIEGVDQTYADSDGNTYGVRWSGLPASVDGSGTGTLAWDGTPRVLSLSLTAEIRTDQGSVSVQVECGN